MIDAELARDIRHAIAEEMGAAGLLWGGRQDYAVGVALGRVSLPTAVEGAPAMSDGFEYQTTKGPRKAWDGAPDLALEGWERLSWERFDYHEEIVWRRPAPRVSLPSEPVATTDSVEETQEVKDALVCLQTMVAQLGVYPDTSLLLADIALLCAAYDRTRLMPTLLLAAQADNAALIQIGQTAIDCIAGLLYQDGTDAAIKRADRAMHGLKQALTAPHPGTALLEVCAQLQAALSVRDVQLDAVRAALDRRCGTLERIRDAAQRPATFHAEYVRIVTEEGQA